MAKTKKNGRDMWLFVDTTTPITTAIDAVTTANFKPVICLTSNGVDVTTSPIESTSKCDGGFADSEAGTTGWTMSADGQIATDSVPNASFGANELLDLILNKTAAWWMIMDVNDLSASEYIRYGVGRLDSYNETFPDQDSSTFTGSVTGKRQLGTQDTISIPVT